MSTSFSYVIFPHHRRRDGTIAVSLRMIHNGKAKYKATPVVVTREQLTKRQDRITDSRTLEQVNALVDEYRRTAADIRGAEWMTADEMWKAVEARMRAGHVFRLDVFDYAGTKIRSMESKTAEGYRTAFNALERYVGRRRLDIGEVTHKFVVGFRTFIEEQTSKGSRATSYYLGCLRHIHNLAREEFNDDDSAFVPIPRLPFRGGVIPAEPSTSHRDLTVEQMRSVMACEPQTERGRMARDMFLLSFCLIGMNTADMFHLTAHNLSADVVTYNRRKTDSVRRDRAEMSVRLEPEALAILNRHQGRARLIDAAERYASHHAFNKNINIGLQEVAQLCGIPKLTTYYARHTWATIARNVCHIDFDTVNKALNHVSTGGASVTDRYVARDWSRVWDANRSVLDIFTENLPKFHEYFTQNEVKKH